MDREGRNAERGFLDTAIPDLTGKSAAEVETLLNKLAGSITAKDVEHQNELLDEEVSKMKEFMSTAMAEGILGDGEDENAEQEGSILLKGKNYNPILDLLKKDAAQQGTAAEEGKRRLLENKKRNAEQSRAAERSEETKTQGGAQTTILKPVVLHIPAGDSTAEEIIEYASLAIEDCFLRNEAAICPLLQTLVAIGKNRLTDEVKTLAVRSMVATRQLIGDLRIYIDLDTKKQFDGVFSTTTVIRALFDAGKKRVEEMKPKRQVAVPEEDAEGEEDANADRDGGAEANAVARDDKTRINRFSKDADGKPKQEFPAGVAGYAMDGRVIPIVNAGKTFDPKIPNVMGDMAYRNDLLTTPAYDPKDWYYRKFDKLRYLVVAYQGPKNCNVKYEDYFMCVFAAVRTKTECAAVVEHVRQKKNCFHGRMFNLGIVELGEWFATAPPRYAKDATASYANPLHREYMESYLNQQKEATVTLEQRVLDDEVRARQKTNTMMQQLQEKGLNPELCATNEQVQEDIEKRRKESAKAAAQRKRQADEEERQKVITEKAAQARAKRMALAQQEEDERRQQNQNIPDQVPLANVVAGGVRRRIPPHLLKAARGRGRGRGGGGRGGGGGQE